MRDKISIPRVEKLHPKINWEVKALIDKAEANFPVSMAIRVAEGLRTIEEQDVLYYKGRDKNGKVVDKKLIVTNAKGGKSFHNYGLAIDFALLHDKDGNGQYEELSWDAAQDFDKDGTIDWQEVVKVFKNAGYEWGGDWRTIVDRPHIQKTFGHSWKELFDKYEAKDFIVGTQYVNI